ncbi:MAG TPA: gamma-glutamyltransferase [Gemmatimonadaceae bacterium]|nr:gamma-glutamyltransferase [Gemmatimonadaceae bacterium]
MLKIHRSRFNRSLSAAALAVASVAALSCRPAAHVGSPSIPSVQAAAFPAGWSVKHRREPVIAQHGIVVSNSDLASAAGAEIMKKGGNAVDAAVATGFALAVTYPFAGNIGGGGFMVIHMADGRSVAMDYREVAPLAATRNMYLDANGNLTKKSLVGALAVGVPGSVAGMADALAKFGTMSLHDVMQPAIRLASEGFTVDSALYRSLNGSRHLISQFDGAKVFLPNGEPPAIGSTLKQPDLARTLTLIANEGPKAFYDGPIADALVAEQQKDGGIITKEDLARYTPIERAPIVGTYRGYTLYAMPPSSSGGITMLETLHQLETWPALPPFGSAEYTHLVAEAFRRAFIDRNEKLGDPAFVKVPMAELTSKDYAKKLAATIDPHHATPSPTFKAGIEPMHTTHYSVVDGQGNAVSTTTTLNSGYGSGAYVAGAGFFLNNEMDDFAAQPGKPNQFGLVQGEANAVQPGKRMLSAMSPTIVLGKDGKVMLVVGAAGGPTIITAVTQVILNVIDQHMSLADAMYAPRIHHQAWPDVLEYEEGGLSQATLDSLVAMGHHLRPIHSLANSNAIMRGANGWEGVVEPRSTGGAVGY